MADLPEGGGAGVRGYMQIIDRPLAHNAPNPGPPIIKGNPNGIGEWLQKNWQPLVIGGGIVLLLVWLFSPKK